MAMKLYAGETKKESRFFIVLIGLVLISAVSFLSLHSAGYTTTQILGRPIALQLRHIATSAAHISDALFLPYYFLPSKIPQYQLTINFGEFNKLNNALGDWDPDVLEPLPADRKVFAKGTFTADGITYDVDVRYRGDSPLHWAYFKKSWLVELKGTELFKRMRRFHLIVPEAQSYYAEMVNQYRAKKLGLITQEPAFVRLILDGYDQGVYVVVEDTTDEWAEKKGLLGHVLSFNGDGLSTDTSIWSSQNVNRWESDTLETSYTADAIATLGQILTKVDDVSFRKVAPILIDLESFYRWNIVSLLARTHDQNDLPPSNNAKLYFDLPTGRFTVIPHHLGVRESEIQIGHYYNEVPLLEARILGIPEFRERRNVLLREYLEKEVSDDLQFYDSLVDGMRSEFLSDFAKTSTNLSYLNETRRLRRVMEENIAAASEDLTYQYPSFKGGVDMKRLPLNRNFQYLIDAVDSPVSFAEKNQSFIFDAESEALRMPAGTYRFRETVIIPYGTRLFIEPGVRIFFDEGVSFVSYSSIEALGTPGSPILITASDQTKPWGAFLVIATGYKGNVFRNVTVSYGSELRQINGLVATGMLAFPRSNVTLESSRIEHSRGEDAFNPKYSTVRVINNRFFNSISDAFDCDVCHGVIEGNYFHTLGTGVNTHTGVGNTGGDALDISFSDVLVKKNVMVGATDKGISVGEASTPIIEDNVIMKNNIGIAIKDGSNALLKRNVIIKNANGIGLYQKKEIFGPGQALLQDSIIWANAQEVIIESDGSVLMYGSGNQLHSKGGTMPDFSKILTPALYREFLTN